jgi:hypothetical protein
MPPECHYILAGLLVKSVRINGRYLTRVVGSCSCREMHHGHSARYWISVQM